MSEAISGVGRHAWRVAALGGGALAAALLFSPSARAVGQAFLGAFRLPQVVAIGLDDQQAAALRQRLDRIQSKFDLPSLIGKNVEIEPPAERPVSAASAAEAGRIAGVSVRWPTWLPEGVTVGAIRAASSGGGARLTADVEFANQALEFLDLRDALLPRALDGQAIAIRLGGRVETSFAGGEGRSFSLVQAQLPEVTLPEGVSLTPFGYAYLRILGLDVAQASEIAATTDWRSTLVVPVPARALKLRQVVVRGRPALLIAPSAEAVADKRRARRRAMETTLAWTEDSQAFILSGALTEQEALTIAGALQ